MRCQVRLRSAELSRAVAKAERTGRAVAARVTMAAREDCKPYVPYVTGALRGTAETESVPERGLLVWGNASVPYARAQYYGCPNKTWPGTCMQWFEPAKAACMARWAEAARQAAGEVCDGR